MKKNYQLHLRIESEIIEQLKKQAKISNLSLAELCRKRIRDSSQLQRIEIILNEMNKTIKYSTKFKQEI